MQQPFNPASVPINYTLNFQQVNLLLEGLGKLPYERVEQLYSAIRGAALQALQAAEQAYNEAAERDAEAERVRALPPEATVESEGASTAD